MKILAVIPARAGSKGIPNKNIRIIGGHPLVYYAIRNAGKSEYITDVIVSTDSPEVKIIAEQMDVVCHWRKEELCGDEVTLDAVVYDAVPKDIKWDYVVTLQPTSPALEVDTLDAGIKYAIEGGYDNVISVLNTPHLSWSMRDGRVIPDYEKRLNRQYLPPHYQETGAFLISKGSCVNEKTRLGSNISVYEIPEAQAIDVDSFMDLQNAAAILNKSRIAFYVNGNNQIGTGHIYRSLELADEFFSKPDIYYDSNQTDPRIFGKTTYNIFPVNGITDLYERCKKEKYTVFINDILSTSTEYMTGLRSAIPDAKIINFEDDGEGIVKADLTINALYSDEIFPNVKAGEKYFIPNKVFMFYNPITIKDRVERVFVSFGGADPQGYSERLLHIISKEDYCDYEFFVVSGRAKDNAEALMKYNENKNIHVLHNISNMPEIMSKCDVGITSRGRVGYELALLGIPSIAIAQNAREEKHGFICNDNGFNYLGLNPSDEIIEKTLRLYLTMSQEDRSHYHKMLLSHDLRGGRKRVMSLINSIV